MTPTLGILALLATVAALPLRAWLHRVGERREQERQDTEHEWRES